MNRAISGPNASHPDSAFITDEVGKILFTGSKPGVVEWLIANLDFVESILPGLGIADILPPTITIDNGFAVFMGKNNTKDNE